MRERKKNKKQKVAADDEQDLGGRDDSRVVPELPDTFGGRPDVSTWLLVQTFEPRDEHCLGSGKYDVAFWPFFEPSRDVFLRHYDVFFSTSFLA